MKMKNVLHSNIIEGENELRIIERECLPKKIKKE